MPSEGASTHPQTSSKTNKFLTKQPYFANTISPENAITAQLKQPESQYLKTN